MNHNDTMGRMSRRDAIRWMMAATGTVTLLNYPGIAKLGVPSAKGYGMDPNMLEGEVPWERTMSEEQLKLAAVLADIILPHVSSASPSATEVKVPDFIDEWISAPYPNQQRDRKIVLPGLLWMDREAERRFGKNFVGLDSKQAEAICDDICHPVKGSSPMAEGSRFFAVFRGLTLGGYYTTAVGMKDVGYVGNVPLASFDGPPPEVMKRLGIDRQPW